MTDHADEWETLCHLMYLYMRPNPYVRRDRLVLQEVRKLLANLGRTWDPQHTPPNEGEIFYALAYQYLHGLGRKANEEKAIGWAEKAVQAGHQGAMNALATYYEEVNPELAFEYQQQLAEATGDPEDICDFAGMLFDGRGTRRNVKRAQSLLQPLLDLDLVVVNELYGQILEHQSDREGAERYLRRAVEQGSTTAMVDLSNLLQATHPEEALAFMKQAGEAGNDAALFNLGLHYDQHEAYETAAEYYQSALEAESTCAANNLGLLYMHGLGVPQNDRIAVDLFRHGAEYYNDAKAMRNLAKCFEEGRGVPYNPALAIMWREQAKKGSQ